jgi:hypothetical protein
VDAYNEQDFRETRCGGTDWIDLVQGKEKWNMAMNLPVPENVWKFFSSCRTGGFPRDKLY